MNDLASVEDFKLFVAKYKLNRISRSLGDGSLEYSMDMLCRHVSSLQPCRILVADGQHRQCAVDFATIGYYSPSASSISFEKDFTRLTYDEAKQCKWCSLE